jgi:hypothetical protein
VLQVEGDKALFNNYTVIVVNPEVHDKVNAKAARDFASFILSASTQEVIRSFGVAEYGEPLFVPDALVRGPRQRQHLNPSPLVPAAFNTRRHAGATRISSEPMAPESDAQRSRRPLSLQRRQDWYDFWRPVKSFRDDRGYIWAAC